MKTILITAIGGDVSQNVASAIRESSLNTRLIGTDINERNAGSLYVDDFIKVPEASSIEYLSKMREIINNFSVDIVIPMSEAELSIFQPIIIELGASRCLTPGQNVLEIGLDKLKTAKTIESLGIKTPWTVDAAKDNPKEFPCIFKPKNGAGAKNIFIVNNIDEAIFFSNKFKNSIFQELLKPSDREITCAVYRDSRGKVGVLQLSRKLVDGHTSWAKVINDSEILKMCKIIAKGLDLKGSMNIQLIITDKGPRVFEINPRFSSTSLMRHRLGFTDVIWAIREAEGGKIDYPNIEVGRCTVRIHNTKEL